MKKFAFLLVAIITLGMFTQTVFADDLKLTYGKEKVDLVLVDDLSELNIQNVTYGSFSVEDSKLIITAPIMADVYGISVPQAEANKELFSNAKYIAFDIKNTGAEDTYFCFQPQIGSTENKFISPKGDKIYFVDNTGLRTEVVWTEDVVVTVGRYSFIIPGFYEGYVLIPVTSLVNINSWDAPAWQNDDYISAVGFNVSSVSGLATTIEIDNMYITGELPAYEFVATAEPTATPVVTNTPSASATPVATTKPSATPANNNNDIEDKNLFVVVGIIAGAVIVVGAVVFIVIKRGKRKVK